MNDETINCGLLMEAAQTHQSLVEAALERLKAHTGELDAIVREEIRRTLVDELQTLAAESKGATRSLRTLRRAANMHVALWSIGITALCCAMMIVVILAAVRWLLPSRAEIAALRSQHEGHNAPPRGSSGATIGGAASDAGRRYGVIASKAPVFGQRADYFILAGY